MRAWRAGHKEVRVTAAELELLRGIRAELEAIAPGGRHHSVEAVSAA